MLRTVLTALARNSSPAGARLFALGGMNWLSASCFHSTRSFAPLSVKIGVNSVCNARCLTCDIGTKSELTPFFRNNVVKDTPEINLDLAKRVVDSLRGVRPRICIDSTEPLLYRDLVPLVRHVKTRRMQSLVLTNGLLLTDRAAGLVDAGLDELVVSIDGPIPVNDRVRGLPGLTERAFEGLREVHRLKRSGKLGKPALRINTVISSHTQHDVLGLLHELKNLGLGLASVSLYHQNFVSQDMATAHNLRWEHELPVTVSNCEQAAPEAVKTADLAEVVSAVDGEDWPFQVRWVPRLQTERQLRRFYDEHDSLVGSARCLAPWMIMRVRPNGEVGVMGRCFDIPLGNCIDDDLLKIFNGVRFRRFRRLLLDNETMPACKRCCGSL